MSRLDAALSYAHKGWRIFPLRGKLPAIAKDIGGRGVHDATIDETKIKQWWAAAEHNIGIAAGPDSGIWILDIDGEEGEESLLELERQHGTLPQTVEAHTGHGRHLYFRHSGTAIPNSVAFRPGLDTRASGGYVVAPPSYHRESGRTYVWSVDGDPAHMEPAEAPAWLLEIVARKPEPRINGENHVTADSYGAAALAAEVEIVAAAPCGEQEGTLNKAALKIGGLVGSGRVSYAAAVAALIAAGLRMANEPGRKPWSEAEIRGKVERGVRDGTKTPREPQAAAAAPAATPAQSAPVDGQFDRLTLDLDAWAERPVPPRDYLLGAIFTTTTRAMLSADTGLGKTHLGFAFGFAMAAGKAFCHWSAGRQARVLLVDGEMSLELLKERLADAESRIGERPACLYALSREDAENMPPLDDPKGQQWLDGLLAHLGGIDFLILDNVMSLTAGDLKEEEAWKPVIGWMLSLTKRRIGVLWINHTGHNVARGYGTKTREWQLDTVMVAEKADDPAADIAMRLHFTKSRQRRRETRADYEAAELRLKDNAWTSEPTEERHDGSQGDYALDLLRRAIADAGEPIPGEPASVLAVPISLWEAYCETHDLSLSDNAKSRAKAFTRAISKLQRQKLIRTKRKKVWITNQ